MMGVGYLFFVSLLVVVVGHVASLDINFRLDTPGASSVGNGGRVVQRHSFRGPRTADSVYTHKQSAHFRVPDLQIQDETPTQKDYVMCNDDCELCKDGVPLCDGSCTLCKENGDNESVTDKDDCAECNKDDCAERNDKVDCAECSDKDDCAERNDKDDKYAYVVNIDGSVTIKHPSCNQGGSDLQIQNETPTQKDYVMCNDDCELCKDGVPLCDGSCMLCKENGDNESVTDKDDCAERNDKVDCAERNDKDDCAECNDKDDCAERNDKDDCAERKSDITSDMSEPTM